MGVGAFFVVALWVRTRVDSREYTLILRNKTVENVCATKMLSYFVSRSVDFSTIVNISTKTLFKIGLLSGRHNEIVQCGGEFGDSGGCVNVEPLLQRGGVIDAGCTCSAMPERLSPFSSRRCGGSSVPFCTIIAGVEANGPRCIRVGDIFSRVSILETSNSVPMISGPIGLKGR